MNALQYLAFEDELEKIAEDRSFGGYFKRRVPFQDFIKEIFTGEYYRPKRRQAKVDPYETVYASNPPLGRVRPSTKPLPLFTGDYSKRLPPIKDLFNPIKKPTLSDEGIVRHWEAGDIDEARAPKKTKKKTASRIARLRTALSKGKQAIKKNPGKSLLAAYLAAPGSFIATGAGISALADAVSGKESKGPTGKKGKLKIETPRRRKPAGEIHAPPKDFDWKQYDKTGIPRLKPEPTPNIAPPIIYPGGPGAPATLDRPGGLAKRLRNSYFELLRRRRA